jgi:hypothetical protein
MTASTYIRRTAAPLLLLAATLGCGKEDAPSQWEIIHGTATLTVSAAVHPDTRAALATYSSRTGTLTIAEDSTTSGWIRIAAGDTVFLAGTVVNDGGELIVTFDDLVPAEYTIITNGDFPDTYGLLSTTVLNSNVTGDASPEDHRIYWQFEK